MGSTCPVQTVHPRRFHDVSTDSVDDVRGGQGLLVQVFCRMGFRITTFLTIVPVVLARRCRHL